jgi:hypothetical protein
MRVSLKPVVAGCEEAYPNHCQEGTNGAKRGLCWCNVNDVLRKIQGINGHIQRRGSTIPPP